MEFSLHPISTCAWTCSSVELYHRLTIAKPTSNHPSETKMAPHIIVVGGGLSGLSAAHTILERGGSVLVLDKNGFFGGNSTKATSGINGALTRTQVDLEIGDSVNQFYKDTMESARDLARPGKFCQRS